MRPTRVFMISHSSISRDARVTRSAAALVEAGFEVVLVCLRQLGEPIPRGLRNVDLRSVSLPSRRPRPGHRSSQPGCPDPSAPEQGDPVGFLPGSRILRIGRFLLKGLRVGLFCRPDVVFVNDVNVLPLGWAVGAASGCRVLLDSHELFSEKVGLRRRGLWRWIERLLVRRCDAVLTTTEMRAWLFAERYGRLPRLTVVRNYPARADGEVREIREAAAIPAEGFVALYQGGIQTGRGLEQIVQAAEHLDAPNVYLVIQGDGPLRGRICELAAASPHRARIRVLPGGHHDYLRSFTASADVGLQVLQPTSINHVSTLSNKLFEYIQSGLPVVAADFPMIRTYVMKYRVGLLVDPRDPRAIAEAISRLAVRAELHQTFADSSRRAAQVLSFEREKSRLVSLVRAIA